jgi:hypothetical protein
MVEQSVAVPPAGSLGYIFVGSVASKLDQFGKQFRRVAEVPDAQNRPTGVVVDCMMWQANGVLRHRIVNGGNEAHHETAGRCEIIRPGRPDRGSVRFTRNVNLAVLSTPTNGRGQLTKRCPLLMRTVVAVGCRVGQACSR